MRLHSNGHSKIWVTDRLPSPLSMASSRTRRHSAYIYQLYLLVTPHPISDEGAEIVSEMLKFSSTVTKLTSQEDFIAFSCCDGFKSNILS